MKSRKNLDLQLLACLDALISECSVTRAADRLGMSQPGMSNALARLRKLTNDELLVRTAKGMVATPRARELAATVTIGMRAFEDVLADHSQFDPLNSTGTVTIASADFPSALIFPALMKYLATHAPGLTVEVRLPDPQHICEWLNEGECDLAIGYFPDLSGSLRSSVLSAEPLVCVASNNHPTIREKITPHEFSAAVHVVVGSPFAPQSIVETLLDDRFRRLGIQRHVGMRVASVLFAPFIVAGSPLIATLPELYARYFASILPLAVLKSEFLLPTISVSMVWHERTHRLGMHTWLRGVIRELVDMHIGGARHPDNS